MNKNYITVITDNDSFYTFLKMVFNNKINLRKNNFQNAQQDEKCVAFILDYFSVKDLNIISENINKPFIIFTSMLDNIESYFNFYDTLSKFIPVIEKDIINTEFNDYFRLNEDTFFSIEKHSIISNEKTFILTNLEFRLIYYLLKNRGNIISVNTLIDQLDLMTPSSLYVCIKKLRKKLESDCDSPSLIVYRKNKGYFLNLTISRSIEIVS